MSLAVVRWPPISSSVAPHHHAATRLAMASWISGCSCPLVCTSGASATPTAAPSLADRSLAKARRGMDTNVRHFGSKPMQLVQNREPHDRRALEPLPANRLHALDLRDGCQQFPL